VLLKLMWARVQDVSVVLRGSDLVVNCLLSVCVCGRVHM
jgi:hypothetical protein